MNILITSAGRRTYLIDYFKMALKGRGKVIVANSIKNSPAMFVADRSYLVPYSWDENYVNELLVICKLQDVRLIISLHDIDVYILSKYKDFFESENIKLLVPDEYIATACLDKLELYKLSNKYGILHCDTYFSLKEVCDKIESGILSFPIMLKPRWGFGSMGLMQVHSLPELLSAYSTLEYKIKKSILVNLPIYEANKAIVIQPMLFCEEFGLNVISDMNKNFKTCLTLKKHEMRSGETFSATTIYDEKLFDFGKRISEMTRHEGIIDVDVLKKNDNYYLLEVNPRFGGHYPFVHQAGADIPSAIIEWMEGGLEKENWLKCDENISFYKDFKFSHIPESRINISLPENLE
jgi:carbamoyl-phosphate synthase large subunit